MSAKPNTPGASAHVDAEAFSEDEADSFAAGFAGAHPDTKWGADTVGRLLATIHELKQRYSIATMHQIDERALGLHAAYKALAGYPEVESLGEGLRRIGLLIDEDFDEHPWLAHLERPEREMWHNEKDRAEADHLRAACVEVLKSMRAIEIGGDAAFAIPLKMGDKLENAARKRWAQR